MPNHINYNITNNPTFAGYRVHSTKTMQNFMKTKYKAEGRRAINDFYKFLADNSDNGYIKIRKMPKTDVLVLETNNKDFYTLMNITPKTKLGELKKILLEFKELEPAKKYCNKF